jgi:transposase-like protein
MGRPPKLTPHQRREVIRRRDRGYETLADIARSYNVSPATIPSFRRGFRAHRRAALRRATSPLAWLRPRPLPTCPVTAMLLRPANAAAD